MPLHPGSKESLRREIRISKEPFEGGRSASSGGCWIGAPLIGWALLVAAAATSGCSAALKDRTYNANCAAGAQFRAHAAECKIAPDCERLLNPYEDEALLRWSIIVPCATHLADMEQDERKNIAREASDRW